MQNKKRQITKGIKKEEKDKKRLIKQEEKDEIREKKNKKKLEDFEKSELEKAAEKQNFADSKKNRIMDTNKAGFEKEDALLRTHARNIPSLQTQQSVMQKKQRQLSIVENDQVRAMMKSMTNIVDDKLLDSILKVKEQLEIRSDLVDESEDEESSIIDLSDVQDKTRNKGGVDQKPESVQQFMKA